MSNFFVLKNAQFIADIIADYPFIKITDIDLIAPVYYPVAEVKIEYGEKSFENFDVIPHLVLELFDIGFTDTYVIGELLSLSKNYIDGIIKGLIADGQISETDGARSITLLGKETLSQGGDIIVKNHAGSQKFEMDALNGRLLKLEEIIDEKSLLELDRVSVDVVIDPNDSVKMDKQNNEFVKDSRQFIRYNRSVLNVNIDQIDNVEFEKMNYARSFLIRLKDGCIMIFSKNQPYTRYELINGESKKLRNKKIGVLAINDIASLSLFRNEKDMPVLNRESQDKVDMAIERIILPSYDRTEADALLTTEDIEKVVSSLYDLRNYEIHTDLCKLIVRADCFNSFDNDLLFFLKEFADDNRFITTSRILRGRYLTVQSDDPLIKEAALKYKAAVDQRGSYEVNQKIKDLMLKESEENVFVRISTLLDNYGRQEDEEE